MPTQVKIPGGIAYEFAAAPNLGAAQALFGGGDPTTLRGDIITKLFADRRTLAASASESLDLSGALANPLGATVQFANVRAIAVKASKTNTNNVVVGGAGANTFLGPFGGAAHTVSIPPGGVFVISAPAAGWTVTAGTGDLLQVANSGAGTAVQYDIEVFGQ